VTEHTPASKGIVLDTSILIELLRSNRRIQARLDALLDSGYAMTTSTACIAELHGGLRTGEEAVTSQLIATLDCLPVTLSIAIRAGQIKVARSKTGRTHGIVDMMIAATALEFGYSIATENKRDFEIPGLTLADLT
jgi:predicted nucleic acid-binding protein